MEKIRVLVVEDDPQQREFLLAILEANGFAAWGAANCMEALQAIGRVHPDGVILDHGLPDGSSLDLVPRFRSWSAALAILILTATDSLDLAVQLTKEGVDRFLVKPVQSPSAVLAALNQALEDARLRGMELARLKMDDQRWADPFLGMAPAVKSLEKVARKCLGAAAPVLLQGETGTGKTMLARWLHDQGPRAKHPFIELNCAGFQKELLESELFGHEKGAFTGAVQPKTGFMEAADGGTLFLDEIGELDLAIQARLLKAIEERVFYRLGDVRPRRAAFALIAATHHDLKALVAARRFREDLYFRICHLVLDVPPLRERREDLPFLAESLMERIRREWGLPGLAIDPAGWPLLMAHSWPGNLRELRIVLERAVLQREGNTIRIGNVGGVAARPNGSSGPSIHQSLAEVEREHIQRVLDSVNGEVSEAARRLGIPRSTLYVRLRKMGWCPSRIQNPES